ncbi:hypothetical protein L7F22_042942 [Adiantum nelumboides]|nr:hypothetical protein [Adiantum nelumboides]
MRMPFAWDNPYCSGPKSPSNDGKEETLLAKDICFGNAHILHVCSIRWADLMDETGGGVVSALVAWSWKLRTDDVIEEASSSQGRQLHEVGDAKFKVFGILQPSLPTELVGAQAQVMHNVNSMETPVRLAESMVETPSSIPIVLEQVFPPPSIHPRYFGGGSVFQNMAGHAPGNQFYRPATVFGGAQGMMPNPMYGNIGMQPRFQSTYCQFGMPQANFDFEKAKCLMNSEVAVILERKYEQMQQLPDPASQVSQVFEKSLQYVKRFGRYQNPNAVKQVREVLSRNQLAEFEVCVIGNLCPDTLEEAKALVPSLAKRSKSDDDENGITDDKIEQMLADLATIKKFE